MTQQMINEDMARFKECSRHIWNTYFLRDGRADMDVGFRFDELEMTLFKCMIIDKYGLDHQFRGYKQAPIPALVVAIKSDFREVPILATNETRVGQNKHWKDVGAVEVSQLSQLQFVSFFSWDSFGFMDLQFVQCFDRQQERLLLVLHQYCDFFVRKEAPTA